MDCYETKCRIVHITQLIVCVYLVYIHINVKTEAYDMPFKCINK